MESGGDPFRKIAILGTGLMGGSLAASLKTLASPPVVFGTTRFPADRGLALSRGWVDRFFDSNLEAASGCDLVVLAVPPDAVVPVWQELSGYLSPATVVTDLSSVKGALSEAYRSGFSRVFPDYLSSHPMAGSERSGIAGARPDLFSGRTVFLTPFGTGDTRQTERRLAHFWTSLGASAVSVIPPRDHDGIVAHLSHVPHALAFALFRLVDRTQREGLYASFDWETQKGGSFSDLLRVARSSPALWAEIFHENRPAILSALDAYASELSRLKGAIETMAPGDLACLLSDWTAPLRGASPPAGPVDTPR